MFNKSAVLRNTIWYTGVSFLSRVVSIPKGIVIGLVLSPDQFGLYTSIYLWFNYLTMVNIGLCSAVSRESAHCFGQKDKVELGIKLQNKAISLDFLTVLIVFFVFIIFSLSQHGLFLITCYALVGITYLLDRISGYYDRFNSARNLFTGIAKAEFIRNVFAPILIIATIYYIKIYALFLIPVIAISVKIIYFKVKMPINFKFTFDFSGIGRYLSAGVYFGASALLSTLYFVIDRTFIDYFLDKRTLGLYSFALMLVMMMQALFANFQSILIDVLNKGSSSINRDVYFNKAMEYNNYLSLLSFLIIILSQLGYYIVVKCYLVNYVNSSPLFIILSTMIYFYAISSLPNVLLFSKLMEKEKLTTLILICGVISGIIFNGIFIYVGWGGQGVALGTVLSQVVMTGLYYYVFIEHSSWINMKYINQMLLLAVIITIYSLLFYYITTMQYPLIYCISFAILGMTVVLIITEYFFKIGSYQMLKGLIENHFRVAGTVKS